MPRLPVVFFRDEDGSVPLLSWLENEIARRDGLTKEDTVPPKEIDLVIRRKSLFEKDPERHSYVKEA